MDRLNIDNALEEVFCKRSEIFEKGTKVKTECLVNYKGELMICWHCDELDPAERKKSDNEEKRRGYQVGERDEIKCSNGGIGIDEIMDNSL